MKKANPLSRAKKDCVAGQDGEPVGEVGKGQVGGMDLLKALGEWATDTWK